MFRIYESYCSWLQVQPPLPQRPSAQGLLGSAVPLFLLLDVRGGPSSDGWYVCRRRCRLSMSSVTVTTSSVTVAAMSSITVGCLTGVMAGEAKYPAMPP